MKEEPLKAALGARAQDIPEIQAIVRQRGFVLSTVLLIGAGALLVASIFFPYWTMRLNAPQYPQGLYMTIYIDHLEGDISEIDGLNHYIGMAPLKDAARIERELAPMAMVAIVLMVSATAFIHRKWFAPLTVPALLLPIVFLADMYYWLHRYGMNLDPKAALSGAIEPFTPTLIGRGVIGQFSTDAALGPGFLMAVAASVMIMFGLHFRRAARLAAEHESRT
jgi:copper chaperone NosL